MTAAVSPTRPVILCALEYERGALVRAGLGDSADIICCGPGAEAVVKWSESVGAERTNVILAGLAGALRESCETGRAYLAATIIAPGGRQYRCAFANELLNPRRPLGGGASGEQPVRLRSAVLASAETILTTPEEKFALAEKASAELADMESAMFAEAATIFGWRWAVIRGVSDGHDEPLPPGIAGWIGTDGRTRVGRVMLSLLRRPWMLLRLMRLRGNSRAAMRAVAAAARAAVEVMLRPVEPVSSAGADATIEVGEARAQTNAMDQPV